MILPKNFIIHVPHPALSRVVQQRAFGLGYRWPVLGEARRTVKDEGQPWLIFDEDMEIMSSSHVMGTYNHISIPDFFLAQTNKKVKITENLVVDLTPNGDVCFETEKFFSREELQKFNEKVQEYWNAPKVEELPESWFILTVNPEFCKMIQERLFELGWGWATGGKKIQYLDAADILVSYVCSSKTFLRDTSKKNEDIIGMDRTEKQTYVGRGNEITINDLFHKYGAPVKRSQTWENVAQHRVYVDSTGVAIGCKPITKEEWNAAMKELI